MIYAPSAKITRKHDDNPRLYPAQCLQFTS
jgi:hypothetical protein